LPALAFQRWPLATTGAVREGLEPYLKTKGVTVTG
jgi:hypothetical protein